ncbi:MAG: hypothetical protein FWC64_02695 [Treponema sp.]|nr:hypothetical protein [Treponema sp.]
MFDADEKGRKASGIDILNASDDIKSVPKTILRGGYTGKIRLAELPLDNSEKDPDALVIAGKIGVMQKAIQEAKEYVPVAKPQKQKAPAFEFFADLSSKRLRCLLRKLERSKLDHDDVQPFVTACKNAFNYDDTGLLLREWGATVKELTNKNDTTPAFLLQVAHKYLSRYMQRQIEKELTPVEELLRRIKIQDVKIELDFEELEINENARNFVLYGGVRSAALMLADIFDGRIIYNAAKNDKRFYFFNGHIWQHEPDVTGVIYNTLLAVIKHFLRANKDSEADDEVKKKEKIRLMDVLRNIEKRTYRVEIQNEFASLKNEGVYHDSDKPDDALHFDGEATKETLTLSDGVLDFSGKELVFRAAKPEEYRSRILDYKIDDVKKGGPCEKIWKFMRGNFKNEDTLQTLMYELCIIMSRAFHKYGGFWIGGKNTGKSTTMQIMKAIFKHYICALDPNVIVPKGKTFVSGNGPTPYLARLPGHGAAFVSEPEDGAYLNAGLWKQLTGGDLVTARGLNEAPKDFRNTAHIIINTNHLPKFDRHDEAVIVRAVVIPFLVSHNANEEGTMRPEEFVEYLKPEFPAFIKLLAEYYVHFKHKLNGVIPISEESEAHKMGYIAEVETDLDRFVNDCFSFEPQSIEVIKKAYEQYNAYHEFDDTSSKRNDALSQHKFTRMIMKNYKDKITEQVRRVVIDGVSKPARCFVGLKLRTLEEVADRSIANSKASGDIFNAVNNQPEPDEGKPF